MLARKFRLTEKRDFEKIQNQGRVYQSDNFGIGILDRKDKDPSRFGFIVSTKIAKDAVDRNRFKRAMSESVRLNSIDLNPGFNVVFLAKTSINRVSTDRIMKEVRVALKESGLLR